MEKVCERCQRVIIKDWEKWLEENKHQAYIQCPYPDCFHIEKVTSIYKYLNT